MSDDFTIDNIVSTINMGDKKKALQKLHVLEKMNYPHASYGIGAIYGKGGGGIQQDYEQALKWFRKAADEERDPFAAHVAGRYYLYGKGTDIDYIMAKTYLEQASANGLFVADRLLGKIYAEGLGVGRDYSKSKQYFEKAISSGSAYALKGLAALEWSEGHFIIAVRLYIIGVLKHLYLLATGQKDLRLK